MPGSVVYGGRSGLLARTAPENLLDAPQLTQELQVGQRVNIIGTDPDGAAPENQVIALTSNSPLVLPTPSFSASTPIKDGQRVTLINAGSHALTIPQNGFHSGSSEERIEPKQMIEAIFKIPIGWIPMEDDVATSSEGSAIVVNSSNYTVPPEVGTILFKGSTNGQHSILLPNPALWPGRKLWIISEVSQVGLLVAGGTQVKKGNQNISSLGGQKSIGMIVIDNVWRQFAYQ